MREVCIQHMVFVDFLQYNNAKFEIVFQPSTLDECFRLDTAYLARLFIIRCVLDHC